MLSACWLRRELAAVESAVRTKINMNGTLDEVDMLQLVPHETPGKVEGQAYLESMINPWKP